MGRLHIVLLETAQVWTVPAMTTALLLFMGDERASGERIPPLTL
jgi:hypothetical protein